MAIHSPDMACASWSRGTPDIQLVAECGSAADAQRVLEAARPDVVTVEVNLPDGDGLRLARELRDRYADIGIVILASQGQDDVLFRALETGVSAFVGKTAPVEELLAAIRHAAVAASSFTASGLAVALARRQTAQERLALSPRETEVLGLLGDGLSIPAIAARMSSASPRPRPTSHASTRSWARGTGPRP